MLAGSEQIILLRGQFDREAVEELSHHGSGAGTQADEAHCPTLWH